MQITFNTEDSIDDLSKIHEILVEAIKKKGGSVSSQPQQIQQAQQPQVQQSQPISQVPGFGSFANSLKQEMSLGLNKPQAQRPQQPKSEIQTVNDEYKRQYLENKNNPDKPKSQNPEIDMSNVYYSEKRRRF
ncbi:MAG: hypothetical protein AABW41_05590 [Nanoarchaeota archaeon]